VTDRRRLASVLAVRNIGHEARKLSAGSAYTTASLCPWMDVGARNLFPRGSIERAQLEVAG
jgi:hypothetical protein